MSYGRCCCTHRVETRHSRLDSRTSCNLSSTQYYGRVPIPTSKSRLYSLKGKQGLDLGAWTHGEQRRGDADMANSCTTLVVEWMALSAGRRRPGRTLHHRRSWTENKIEIRIYLILQRHSFVKSTPLMSGGCRYDEQCVSLGMCSYVRIQT